MISVLFFAQTRELIGTDSVQVPATLNTVEAIRSYLITENPTGKWDLALDASRLLAAVNQSIVPFETTVKAGDEVAFFPPVTGG